jgi:hypothetical protein
MKAVSIGAVAIGFTMLVLSTLWASLFPPSSSWTAEKSARASEIKARLSNLGPLVMSPSRGTHSGPDPGTLAAEFEALKKEEQQLNAEFESARDNPQTMKGILKWSGIGLAVLGLIAWYATKSS